LSDKVDPWGSREIKIDERLIQDFGLTRISKEDRNRIPNSLFQRGIVVAHRDFDTIRDCMEHRKPFIQMTGIASSGPLHLGHKVDVDMFLFFKRQGARSFFGVCDLDAYVSRPFSKIPTLAKAKEYAVDNIAHLLALGVEKEDIYLQSQKERRYYEFAFEISKLMTENTFKAIYGHLDVGKLAANLLQYADILHQQLKEFSGPMPSITGIGIEQDPHARACRDIAKRLPYRLIPPSFVYFLHQPGLQPGKKMSSSEPETAIFLSDSPEDVRRKIDKAYSGGRDSLEEHRRLGGVPEKDKAFEILLYHHPDQELVQKLHDQYKEGTLTSGELKRICKEFLTDFLTNHQEKLRQAKKTAEKMVWG
jgi:tryptophanyl-tRNA synthetase